jgi:hypothetical protein
MDALVEQVDESPPTNHRLIQPIDVFGTINVHERMHDLGYSDTHFVTHKQ